uniref:Protein MAIN-LIKE 1-like n=1 Tax=Cicer arietinum TaxID=3827 RepID=A0A3Q7YAS7_CICAR|nr:protein MAIN-LIKE 1-like [Cicer arietinum]
MIDKGLIYVFVERWHRDTNNFHLPIGEKTITLDDVSSLLHIPITGAFFSVNIFNKDDAAELLGELLGVSLAAAYAEFNLTRTTTVGTVGCLTYTISDVLISIGRWLQGHFFYFWWVAPCSATRVHSQ